MLNAFHQAGLLISGATKGIPRVEELLNASKNPKSIFYRLKPGILVLQKQLKQYEWKITRGDTCSTKCMILD